MFLTDLLDKAYLTEQPANASEILLVPAGLKQNIDQNMVVSRSDFEEVIVQYRAKEPVSEAILMAIGKAKDITDPVWNTLFSNECVLVKYTELCNSFYAAQLEKLETQNPPADLQSRMPLMSSSSGSTAFSMNEGATATPDVLVQKSAVSYGQESVFVPPKQIEEEEEERKETEVEERTDSVDLTAIDAESQDDASTEDQEDSADSAAPSSLAAMFGAGPKTTQPPVALQKSAQRVISRISKDFDPFSSGIEEDASSDDDGFRSVPVFKPDGASNTEMETEFVPSRVSEEDEIETAFIPPKDVNEDSSEDVSKEPLQHSESIDFGFVPPIDAGTDQTSSKDDAESSGVSTQLTGEDTEHKDVANAPTPGISSQPDAEERDDEVDQPPTPGISEQLTGDDQVEEEEEEEETPGVSTQSIDESQDEEDTTFDIPDQSGQVGQAEMMQSQEEVENSAPYSSLTELIGGSDIYSNNSVTEGESEVEDSEPTSDVEVKMDSEADSVADPDKLEDSRDDVSFVEEKSEEKGDITMDTETDVLTPEEEQVADEKVKATSGVTNVGTDAENIFGKYGFLYICAASNVSIDDVLNSIAELCPATRSYWEGIVFTAEEEVNEMFMDIVRCIKQYAYRLVDEGDYDTANKILEPIMRLIYQEG